MHDLTPELAALADRLTALQPATSVSRERLLYEAGRAAGEAQQSPILRRAVWPALTVVVAVAALSLGRWTAPVTYQPIYTYVARETPASLAEVVPNAATLGVTSPDSYLRLREQLANSPSPAFSADGQSIAAPPASRHHLFEQLLN